MDRRIGRILTGFVGCGLIIAALVLARARKPAPVRSGSTVNPKQTREACKDRRSLTRQLLLGNGEYGDLR
jgi:hypothetical protein